MNILLTAALQEGISQTADNIGAGIIIGVFGLIFISLLFGKAGGKNK